VRAAEEQPIAEGGAWRRHAATKAPRFRPAPVEPMNGLLTAAFVLARRISKLAKSHFVVYKRHMFVLKQTEQFRKWRTQLEDTRARALVASRLDRLSQGHWGDVEPVGEGVSELRIHYGPGYRIYVTRRGEVVVVLLCGGSKRTQARDIKAAKELGKIWSE
jgi:putative addiction module killer protein